MTYLTDRQAAALARRAQAGDDFALRRLVADLKGLGFAEADQLYAPGLDRDDLRQVALAAVWEAVDAFRPGGAPLRTFALLVVRRRLHTALTTARRGKHGPVNHSVSLHTPIPDTDGATLAEAIPDTGLGPADAAIVREDLAAAAAAVLSLSELEQFAVREVRLHGRSYDQAADLHPRWTVKVIDNALQRANRKIRQAVAA